MPDIVTTVSGVSTMIQGERGSIMLWTSTLVSKPLLILLYNLNGLTMLAHVNTSLYSRPKVCSNWSLLWQSIYNVSVLIRNYVGQNRLISQSLTYHVQRWIYNLRLVVHFLTVMSNGTPTESTLSDDVKYPFGIRIKIVGVWYGNELLLHRRGTAAVEDTSSSW